jgi:hypothetical protein
MAGLRPRLARKCYRGVPARPTSDCDTRQRFHSALAKSQLQTATTRKMALISHSRDPFPLSGSTPKISSIQSCQIRVSKSRAVPIVPSEASRNKRRRGLSTVVNASFPVVGSGHGQLPRNPVPADCPTWQVAHCQAPPAARRSGGELVVPASVHQLNMGEGG